MRTVLMITIAWLVLAAYAGQRQADTSRAAARRAVPTNTISVLSCWPDRGVEVQVSRMDVNGLRYGWTPFERRYPARGSVKLKAPEAAGGCSFHHWEIAKDKYLRTRAVRIVPSRDMQATVVFLHAEGARSFEYRVTRRRDTVIASGFDPPLATLFADGKARGFGIRGLGNDTTPLHGPFALESHGNGTLWMYNGSKQRTAVIRCYLEHDLVVYVAYTNLPHEFALFTWAPEAPQGLGAAPHQQQQKNRRADAGGDDAHRNLGGCDERSRGHVTQSQDHPAQQR